ncbi:hypothetical protein GCM10010913_22360 [Paenibacillus aceti]|uniref:Uncharacterized protein n=1 Tax=Paenibacillus aceti TaxID=1820010 RepID=A0ABQ1VUQ9_9BACL|nr:hypothetical protein GCM10010913_22360 [Paenibacillus aceti]
MFQWFTEFSLLGQEIKVLYTKKDCDRIHLYSEIFHFYLKKFILGGLHENEENDVCIVGIYGCCLYAGWLW